MPFKVFVNGNILPDSDLNDYLMEQAVISCTSGTRPSSPNDGMLCWETDTERYTTYNASIGSWVPLGQIVDGTYTPALTAATTNPTLGTGSTATARYTLRNGKWCDVCGIIAFGSSGAAAGSGQYFISLPFTTANDMTVGVQYFGNSYLRRNTGPAIAQAMTYAAPGASTLSLVANNATVTNAAPWAWSNVDYIGFSITFRTA